MKTLNKVTRALKGSFFSFSVPDNLMQSFVRWDFKIGDNQTNLMQVCFSSVAAFWLIAFLLVLNFDLTPVNWSLTNIFGHESVLILTILDGRLNNMMTFFFIFFVIEWLIRKETILLILIGYFLSRGEWHLNLAVASALGIYLSRITYFFWAGLDLDSEAKTVWNNLHRLQLLIYVAFAAGGLWTLDFFQSGYLLQKTGYFSRLNFFIYFLIVFHFANQILLSLWGHFYFKKIREPSDIWIHYSTANFILRFNIAKPLLKQIIDISKVQIQKNEKHKADFQELQKINPVVTDSAINHALEKTQTYLKEALARAGRA